MIVIRCTNIMFAELSVHKHASMYGNMRPDINQDTVQCRPDNLVYTCSDTDGKCLRSFLVISSSLHLVMTSQREPMTSWPKHLQVTCMFCCVHIENNDVIAKWLVMSCANFPIESEWE